MVPADEGLDADDVPRLHLEDRLVVEGELLARERAPEAALEVGALLGAPPACGA